MRKKQFLILVIGQIFVISIVAFVMVIYFQVSLSTKEMRDVSEVDLKRQITKFEKYKLSPEDSKVLELLVSILDSSQEIISSLSYVMRVKIYFLIGILVISIFQVAYFSLLYYRSKIDLEFDKVA